MPDPIWKRSGYGRRAARIEPNRIIMPDPTFRLRFGSVLPKKTRVMRCKTDPDPIWTAWSGFSQTHPVRKQVGVQEAYGQVPAECNRPATSFPLSHSVAFFTDGPDNIVQNQPKIDWVPDDCVRFWSNESGTEASLEMTHLPIIMK